MLNDWKTFGHVSTKAILEKQIKAGKFAHAYLFVGPEGIGKKSLALEFAQNILQKQELKNHPDFNLMEISSSSSIEDIRDFLPTLSFKPFIAKHKVAIINNANFLNVQSSNAILKTLEEPSASTIIILIATSGSMLPTIVSRCQVFNLNIFSLKQMQDFAQEAGLKVKKEYLSLSFGSPAKLQNLAANKDEWEKQEEIIKDYEHISQATLAEKLLAIAKFAELEVEELKQIFSTWLSWQVNELKNNIAKFNRLSALSEALADLKTNKNKKLILQGLFLKL